MTEIELRKNKNGMVMLILLIVLYVLAIMATVIGAGIENYILVALGVIYISLGWIFFLGLKVLNPQEALVLTLFGNYIGTLKGEGFYFVNPFCTAINPAANTKLNQSGDVSGVNLSNQIPNKKISLKTMTLNNNRQKINDVLGNPVEIGIAVTWRVVDTAKAVFNVDNYTEYL